MQLSSKAHSSMVYYILQEKLHTPFVNGKANRDNIENAIVQGVYDLDVPPIDQDDVDCVISLVNELIENYGTVDNE